MLAARVRRLILLLAAFTALALAGCASVSTTPDPGSLGLQTRVGAFNAVGVSLTRPTNLEGSCVRPSSSVSAVQVVAGFCVAPEDATSAAVGGENAFTAYGRAAHAAYDYGPGFEKEFTLENGQRADAVNLATREVVELKPNNPAAIARGLRQVQGYAQQLDQEYPGEPFSYRVQPYDRP